MYKLDVVTKSTPLSVHRLVANTFINRWRVRLQPPNNKNLMVLVVGSTGSGKSVTALSLAKQIDASFVADRFCNSAFEFLKALNTDLPRGSALVYDEVGVSMYSREWFSKQNKECIKVFQSFRHENLAVFFTSPTMNHVDSDMLPLFHYILKVDGRASGGSNACRIFEVDPASVAYKSKGSQRYYLKSPRFAFDGKVVYMPFMYVFPPDHASKPSESKLWSDCEKKMSEGKTLIRQDALVNVERAQVAEEKKHVEKKVFDLHGVVETVLADLPSFVRQDKFAKHIKNETRYLVSAALISSRFNVGEILAKRVKNIIEADTRFAEYAERLTVEGV